MSPGTVLPSAPKPEDDENPAIPIDEPTWSAIFRESAPKKFLKIQKPKAQAEPGTDISKLSVPGHGIDRDPLQNHIVNQNKMARSTAGNKAFP
jgi:hypothetical protein